VEQLEDRTVPSGLSYTAKTVSDLIFDINAANQAGGSNTINLAAGVRFTLTDVKDWTDGPTGLPVIAAGDNLTIVGNGDTIERSTAKGTPAFRLFDVAAGASLILQDMTVQGGYAGPGNGYPNGSYGGGIFSADTLTLSGVTVQNNVALSSGADARGGGIYSTGSLTMTGGVIRTNKALGGSNAYLACGDAYGGGVYASASASLSNVTISGNLALGGSNAYLATGGDAYGGGVYASASASLSNVTISGNLAQGGDGGVGDRIAGIGWIYDPGGHGGGAYGGGVCFLPSSGSTALEVTGCTVSSNSAVGGHGGDKGQGSYAGNGGGADGGGLFLLNGTATLKTDIDTANTAQGGKSGTGGGGADGGGVGGAVYIAEATVYIDVYTLSHFSRNKATYGSDIDGAYTQV
jgi:hypothetical protein